MNVKRMTLALCVASAAGAAGAQGTMTAWTAHYDGPGRGKDNAQALAVDAAGNAYVTGFSDGGDGNYDFATLKYDAQGKQVWVARYDGDAHGADRARAVVVDADGSVVVAGSSAGADTSFDFATIKYDAEGHQLWVSRYDGPAHADDRLKALVVDGVGNIYVTGDSRGGDGAATAVTVKYGPDGELRWAERFPFEGGSLSPADIAVDDSGNVYVTGGGDGKIGDRAFVTVKYDHSGQPVWTAYRNWSVHDDARYLGIDEQGNVYVAGDIVSRTEDAHRIAHEDTAIVKYDSSGKELWSHFSEGSDGSNDITSAFCIDSKGNSYLGSTALPLVDESRPESSVAYVVAKYGPDGDLIWTNRRHAPDQAWGRMRALALDAEGNVYALWSARGAADRQHRLIMAKHAPDGEELWVGEHEGLATAAANSLFADAAGSVWVNGSDSEAQDYQTVKYVEFESASDQKGRP